jgi:hypothetical protein
MDVGKWLRNLGLEQYEVAFRENAVTATLLSNLTADDLKDLGTTSVVIAANCWMRSPRCASRSHPTQSSSFLQNARLLGIKFVVGRCHQLFRSPCATVRGS